MTENILATEVKEGDTVLFHDSEYEVTFVGMSSEGLVRIVYRGTNGGYPYYYDPTEVMIRVIK